MKATNWIPKPSDLVRWEGKIFKIVSIDLGGKCRIKQFTTTKRIGKTFTEIDVSELKKVS